jgi:hypothetical protein
VSNAREKDPVSPFYILAAKAFQVLFRKFVKRVFVEDIWPPDRRGKRKLALGGFSLQFNRKEIKSI